MTEVQPAGFMDGQEQNGMPPAVVGPDMFSGILLNPGDAIAAGSLPATGPVGGVHRLKWVTCCTARRPDYRHRSDAAWPKQR